MFDIEAVTDHEAFNTPRARDERGMTTAEYAVGTVAAVGFAGVLIKILTSEEVREIILQLILALIQFFLGQLPTVFG
ncbi:DUF4244 domain-containing protein [Ammonicoccus fulvus]|uniref:DUF4244 domain-containing protein n=1 Tax=Ammonicoccus fulvus TaxID=3138240 RepID=A0ABZ3FKQ7_9ACTN